MTSRNRHREAQRVEAPARRRQARADRRYARSRVARAETAQQVTYWQWRAAGCPRADALAADLAESIPDGHDVWLRANQEREG